MISSVATSVASAIPDVSCQDSAPEVCRDVLGFDVVMDAEMEEQSRWLEVKPSGAQKLLVVAAAAVFGRQPGDGAFFTVAADDVATDDVATTVEQLRARGATPSDVTREPWGPTRRSMPLTSTHSSSPNGPRTDELRRPSAR